MKKIELKAVVFDQKMPGIVKKLFNVSFEKGKLFRMVDVKVFVKNNNKILQEKINYLRDFSFQDITLYKVPKVMQHEEVEKLCDVMENAQKFLTVVREKFEELQKQQLAA